MQKGEKQKKIIFIIGTRPEMIKFAPLILKLRESSFFNISICFTGQHKELLDDTANFFCIKPDVHLSLMSADQGLGSFISRAILELEKVLKSEVPDLVFVQGDTSTVLAGAMASFYQRIPLAHLEAGLRSHDLYNPFPEEMNRVQTSRLASLHFAPTKKAANNLVKEGINKKIWIVGNTVIDALTIGLDKIKSEGEEIYKTKFSSLNFEKKYILITIHRRENFGKPMDEILEALQSFATGFPDVQLVIPVHPNPNVKSKIEMMMGQISNVFLFSPFSYAEMIWMMCNSYFIVTDSGGIQEEAPTLKKPLIVLRNTTERTESNESGLAVLTGSDKNKIIGYMTRLMEDNEYYGSFITNENPYGDGKASEKIIEILNREL